MGNEFLVELARRKNSSCANLGRQGCDEKVLFAMAQVDRKDFLPQESRKYAYVDRALSIGYEGTCSQPSLVAMMIHLLEIKPGMNVLEIGLGCGYSAAIIKHMLGGKGRLTAIEIVPELYQLAKDNFMKHFDKFDGRVKLVNDDGSEGYIKNGPYDRICLTAAPDIQSFNLNVFLDQLLNDGILLFPESSTQKLQYYRKRKGKIVHEEHGGVVFVALKGRNK